MKQNEVIAKAWKDPTFKRKLMSDPKSALKECGCHVPENVNIKVIEDSDNSYTFVIPHAPKNASELSEKELGRVAASGIILLDFGFDVRA
jgi:hypothetical protein